MLRYLNAAARRGWYARQNLGCPLARLLGPRFSRRTQNRSHFSTRVSYACFPWPLAPLYFASSFYCPFSKRTYYISLLARSHMTPSPVGRSSPSINRTISGRSDSIAMAHLEAISIDARHLDHHARQHLFVGRTVPSQVGYTADC